MLIHAVTIKKYAYAPVAIDEPRSSCAAVKINSVAFIISSVLFT